MKTKIKLFILALMAVFAISSIQEASCQTNILAFDVTVNTPGGVHQFYSGLIDPGDATVTFWVPSGTDLTDVALDVILEYPATIDPEPAAVSNLTNPVVFTVKNGVITKNWTVTVIWVSNGSTIRIGDSHDPLIFEEIFSAEPVEEVLRLVNDGASSLSLESLAITIPGLKSGGALPFVISQQPAKYPVVINGLDGGTGVDEVEVKIQFDPSCPGVYEAVLEIGYNGTFTELDLEASYIADPLIVSLSGEDHVYSGYLPEYQTSTIVAAVSGGTPPYSYEWSNGETTSSITAIPEISTSYSVTVTDGAGCTAVQEFEVEVENVQVIKGKTVKIIVCHNGHVLCINERAVPASLNAGAHLGLCTLKQGYVYGDEIVADELSMDIFPNPSNGTFTVEFNMIDSREIVLDIKNITGASVYRNIVDGMKESLIQEINMTDQKPGLYFLTVNDGNTITCEKLIIY